MFDTIGEIEREGILPARWLRDAVWRNVISSDYRIPDENFQPASLDLRLGETAHILQCSFLPSRGTLEEKLAQLTIGTIDIRDGAILERNRPYLIPLLESLRLPEGIRARTNPKSSTGRLDIFTRVITNSSDRFDDIEEGYQGPMYLEVFSRSFSIRVRTRLSLNQIRLFKGDSRCAGSEIQELHDRRPIVLPRNDRPGQFIPSFADNSVGLGVDLTGADGGIGYRARKNSKLLDLSQTNRYDPGDFWEPVFADKGQSLILEPEEFYLLSSSECVCIPPELAGEMTAYDASSGEIRTHYAGFFDPGFGYGEDGRLGGIPPVLEVRAHDVPFMIGPGQKVGTLTFERMLEVPDYWYGPRAGSSYQERGRVLSKHFDPGMQTRQLKMLEGDAGRTG